MNSVAQFQLAPRQAITLRESGSAVLRVRIGRIWLTCSGDPQDHFLVAGDVMRLGPGRVVVEADGPLAAQFEVQTGYGVSMDLPLPEGVIPVAR